MSKIIIIGSLNMDLIIHTPRIPEVGETITGSGFATLPGGKGANQAYSASRAGASVSMIGRVGDDEFGQRMKQSLIGAGVNVDTVKVTPNTPTGVAVITVANGDNSIILDAGANGQLSPKDIEENRDLILSADAILLQLEIPQKTIDYILTEFRGRVPIFLNPAPARKFDTLLLFGVDYFTPNQIEAEFYSNMPIKTKEDAFEAITFFISKGVAHPIITMGLGGICYFDGINKKHMPAFKVDAVDTTGAGDTFSGVLAQYIVSGVPIDESIRYAQAAAAISVTRYGAQASMPDDSEIRKFLDENN